MLQTNIFAHSTYYIVFFSSDCPYCWTLLHGTPSGGEPPNYTPGPSATPGARQSACEWTDVANGNLYLFGGVRWGGGDQHFADLWRYSVSLNQWSFLAGSNVSNFGGNYGQLNVSSPQNAPPSRYGCTSWLDPNDRMLYMFGGLTGPGTAHYSDMWQFSLDSGLWTWISGSSSANSPGNYGILGQWNATNEPPSRHQATGCIDPTARLIYLFGGRHYPNIGLYGNPRNDVWVFNMTRRQWAWVQGSSSINQAGQYGSQGVPSGNNTPGSRAAARECFLVPSEQSLYIFGGSGFDDSGSFGYLDDVWRLSLSDYTWTWVSGSNATNVVANYNASNGPLSPGGRDLTSAGWSSTDMDGFYIYGGTSAVAVHSDVWLFSFANRAWRHLKGTDQSDLWPPAYQVQGVANETNTPATRTGVTLWTFQYSLYLYGGALMHVTGQHYSDLWSFEIPHLLSPEACLLCNLNEVVRNNTTVASSIIIQLNQTVELAAVVNVLGNVTGTSFDFCYFRETPRMYYELNICFSYSNWPPIDQYDRWWSLIGLWLRSN